MPTPVTSAVELHHRAAPIRAGMYELLADLLSYPTPAVAGALVGGDLAGHVADLLERLPYRIETDPAGLHCAADPVEIESEFIRLFDAPVKGEPIPLYGGVYHGDRKAVMEELLRFYRHFGLTTAEAAMSDLPDAVPTVLEFMAFLVLREGGDPTADAATSSRRAQRDLLARHLGVWIPSIDRRLILKEPLPCYRVAVKLTEHFVAGELASLS